MKKATLTALALTCAVGVFAQGTVVFNNRNTYTSHVWGTTRDDIRISGNSSIDYPPGTTVYPGMSLIGTTGGPFGASTTFAALLGAPAGSYNFVQASAGGQTTFRTGAAAGNIVGQTATFNNIPADAPSANFEMAVWDDSSGLYSTWALAALGWQAGLVAAGISDVFTLQAIGGQLNTPPFLNMMSFNINGVPEPATVALAGLGVAALVISRRRKP
jgi:hypothetical protein